MTKIIAEATLLRTPGIAVLGDWFQLRLVYNQGAAFGLHLGPYSRWIFLTVAVVAVFVLHRMSRTSPLGDSFRQLALGLVAGGAAGNLIDRIRSERGVVDFLDVGHRGAALADLQRGRHRRELRRHRAGHLDVAGGLPTGGAGVGVGGVTAAGPLRVFRRPAPRPSGSTASSPTSWALSRTQAARLVADKAVTVDGKPARASRTLARGELVAVQFPEHEPPRTLRPASIPLVVVFEDEHLAVIDKPAGLVVHPAPGPLGRHPGQRARRPRHDSGRRRGGPARRGAPAGPGHLGTHGRRQDRSGPPASRRGDRRAAGPPHLRGARLGPPRRRARPSSRRRSPGIPCDRKRMTISPQGRQARTDALRGRALRRGGSAAARAALRPDPPDPGAPGAHRPPDRGRSGLRRRGQPPGLGRRPPRRRGAGAGDAEAGASRGRSGIPPPGDRRAAGIPGRMARGSSRGPARGGGERSCCSPGTPELSSFL